MGRKKLCQNLELIRSNHRRKELLLQNFPNEKAHGFSRGIE